MDARSAVAGRANPDEWRRTVAEIAKAVAPGWERQRARIEEGVAPLREWMIRELAPGRGGTLLEIAAGVGDTGFEAVAIAGGGSRLISTDVSPEMVAAARRRGTALALRNVEYRIMDGERLELDAESVDGVICRFGYMLMADPSAALAESRRVLREGKRLVLAVWSAPERNPWITILAATLVEHGHIPPLDPASPNPFSMASEALTRAAIEAAGFATVRTHEVPTRFAFRDIDDYMQFASDTAGPIAPVLRALSSSEVGAVKAQVGEAFPPFAVEDGYELPGLALTAVAS